MVAFSYKSRNFVLNTKFYKNIILPVPPNNIVPLGTPCTSHNSWPWTTAVVRPGQEPASSNINKSTRSPRMLEGLAPLIPSTSD